MDFNARIIKDAARLMETFGEPIIYTTKNGISKDTKGIVSSRSLDARVTESSRGVADEVTVTILVAEIPTVDRGGDKITIVSRIGQGAKPLLVKQIIYQDPAVYKVVVS